MTTIDFHGKKIGLGKHMLEALQYALQHPTRWYNIGQDKAGQLAAKRLEDAGLVTKLASNALESIALEPLSV